MPSHTEVGLVMKVFTGFVSHLTEFLLAPRCLGAPVGVPFGSDAIGFYYPYLTKSRSCFPEIAKDSTGIASGSGIRSGIRPSDCTSRLQHFGGLEDHERDEP